MFLHTGPYRHCHFTVCTGQASCPAGCHAVCPEQSWNCQGFCGLIPTGPSHAENVCTHDIMWILWINSLRYLAWCRWSARGEGHVDERRVVKIKIRATSFTICLREIPPSLLWTEEQVRDITCPQGCTQGGGNDGRRGASKVNTSREIHTEEEENSFDLSHSLDFPLVHSWPVFF